MAVWPAKQPNVRFQMIHTLVPDSLDPVERLAAPYPLPDKDAYAEGRIIGIGSIVRRASTSDGDIDVSSADLEMTDSDAYWRSLLAGPNTRFITAREGALQIRSEEGAALELDYRDLFRGRIVDIQLPIGRKARIRLSDIVGSTLSRFNLQKKIGLPITLDMFPDMPPESVNRNFPIITGEHNDYGKKDANGEDADKGVLPFVDTGWRLMNPADGSRPDDATIARLQAPEEFNATRFGTAGVRTRKYQITTLSKYGESTPTVAAVMAIPDNIGEGTGDSQARVELEWGETGEETAGYRAYVNGQLAETLGPDVHTWTDDNSRAGTGSTVPTTNTALIDQEIGGVLHVVRRMYIAKIGAGSEIQNVYASNLEGTPKRVRLPEGVYGEQVWIYGRTGWPHPDPFIEENGIRFAVMYAVGPLVDHAVRNVVDFAWNGCGDDEVGDGSGRTITAAFRALQHLINVYGLINGGNGYRTGNFPGVEAWSTGAPMLKTSAFLAAQEQSAAWIGGEGYPAAIAVLEPTTLREILRMFAVSFGCYYGSNHFGQFYPFLIDDSAQVIGRPYREYIEIKKVHEQNLDHDGIETKVIYHFDYDWDARTFRFVDIPLEDEKASAAHGSVLMRQKRQCFYVRDPVTAHDVNSRYLLRQKFAKHTMAWSSDLTALEEEIGARTLLTSNEGLGADGEVDTPFVVMAQTISDLTPGEESVILLGLDLKRINQNAFPPLGEKGTGSNILGIKGSPEPPPIGAYELR